jgi:hypothetical protein
VEEIAMPRWFVKDHCPSDTLLEPVPTILVLGSSHDLSAQVKRLGGGRCDYVRVTTTRYREADGED